MEIVPDTNVFIAAMFEGDEHCRNILLAEHRGQCSFVLSIPCLDEVMMIFIRHALVFLEKGGGNLHEDFIKPQLELSRAWLRSRIVYPRIKQKFCTDPEDNKFIYAAIEGCARYIISNDGMVLKLNRSVLNKAGQEIEVLQPPHFNRLLLKHVKDTRTHA